MPIQKQLFKRKPTTEILLEILLAFELDSLHDTRWFSRETMAKSKTVEKMRVITKKLMNYYLPCKARNYLHIITDKICITILRQILREFGYCLFGKEIYQNKRKFMMYRMEQQENQMICVRSIRSSSPETVQSDDSQVDQLISSLEQ